MNIWASVDTVTDHGAAATTYGCQWSLSPWDAIATGQVFQGFPTM